MLNLAFLNFVFCREAISQLIVVGQQFLQLLDLNVEFRYFFRFQILQFLTQKQNVFLFVLFFLHDFVAFPF